MEDKKPNFIRISKKTASLIKKERLTDRESYEEIILRLLKNSGKVRN